MGHCGPLGPKLVSGRADIRPPPPDSSLSNRLCLLCQSLNFRRRTLSDSRALPTASRAVLADRFSGSTVVVARASHTARAVDTRPQGSALWAHAVAT